MRWPFARRRGVAIERARSAVGLRAMGAHLSAEPAQPLDGDRAGDGAGAAADVRGLTVLDAGCGTGRYLRELQAPRRHVIGMDLSLPMLERAQDTTTRITRADIRALPFDAMSIDLVVCGLALGDVPEIELALAEIARVLRPGGVVIYSVVHPAGEAAGWTRTFESDGRLWAIDGFWHSLDRHRQACAAAGLAIEECREPALAEMPHQRAVLVMRAARSTNVRRDVAPDVMNVT